MVEAFLREPYSLLTIFQHNAAVCDYDKSPPKFNPWSPKLLRKCRIKMDPIKRQVLVVDDNQDIRELITQMLVSEDYDVLTAKDGEEALELIKSHRLDLILLDIMMPGKSGMEVLEEIKKLKKKENRDIPVIMITAKSTIDDIEAALSAGATSYIVKPFHSATLKTKIRNTLELPKSVNRDGKVGE